jgi:hypothetical protein
MGFAGIFFTSSEDAQKAMESVTEIDGKKVLCRWNTEADLEFFAKKKRKKRAITEKPKFPFETIDGK